MTHDEVICAIDAYNTARIEGRDDEMMAIRREIVANKTNLRHVAIESLSELSIHARSSIIGWGLGVRHVPNLYELVGLTKRTLLKRKNLGKKTAAKIELFLSLWGLALKASLPDDYVVPSCEVCFRKEHLGG